MSDSAEEKPPSPTPFQKRVLWRAITGISIAVLGALLVGVIIVLGRVLGFLQPVLVPLAMAGILAYLLDPVVAWVRSKKFMGRDLTRLPAIGIVFFLATSAILILALSVVPPVIRQINKLIANRATIVENAQVWADDNLMWLDDFVPAPEGSRPAGKPPEPAPEPNPDASAQPESETTTGSEAAEEGLPEEVPTLSSKLAEWLRSDEMVETISSFAVNGVQGFMGAIGYIIGFALVPVYLFFFLKDSATIRERWADYIPLRRSGFKDEVVDVLREINSYLISFFRGQVLVSLIDGALTGIALAILGLPYAIVIGVFLGILGVIPYVGIVITWIPAVLIAAAHFQDWQHPVYVSLIFLAVQQIDGLFIQPKIVGDSVGLHPLTVIFSVLFWSLLIGGLLGALMAVPLTASIKVLFQRYVWEKRIQPTVMGQREPDPPPEPAA